MKVEGCAVRIIVTSDSHGRSAVLAQVLLEQPGAELFLFLGDGERDVEEIKRRFPEKPFLCVAGNCDAGSGLPLELETVEGGKRIFMTHGHKYGVKFGDATILAQAARRHADILLYGHTHHAFTSYEDGLYVLNPGSLGHPDTLRPTYGVIDITKAGIAANIVEV